MRITVIRKRTREPIFDFDSKSGIAVCKNGYDVKVIEDDNWISVKDRMPEEGKLVLVYDEDEGVEIASWHYCPDLDYEDEVLTENWITTTGYKSVLGDIDVTHWQPLPEPPKEAIT